jgi:D-inositol-3-phosphate glycosyltransferase
VPSSGRPPVRRVAVLSVHSSPAAPPGSGDAGGMNTYIRSVSRQLAALGVACDLYTRAEDPAAPEVAELEPGVRLLHLRAGPPEPVPKRDLHGHLAALVCALLRAGAEHGPYDLIHSHYWLSGRVARVLRQRWQVPFVHTFHTLGKVKNAALGAGEVAEPASRLLGEERVAACADRLVAATSQEARQLTELYGASPARIRVVGPGVDGGVFFPGDRAAARASLGIRARHVLAFVGRLQPLKGPDVAIRALGELRRRRADLDVELLVVGGASGGVQSAPARLAALARAEGVAGRVRFLPPRPHRELVTVYRAADLVVVPSRSESFGLVALEAQACGTPVAAARVGGLTHAVGDGTTGVLVGDRHPASWAAVLERLLSAPRKLAAMGAAAERFSRSYRWEETAGALLAAYSELLAAPGEPALTTQTC